MIKALTLSLSLAFLIALTGSSVSGQRLDLVVQTGHSETASTVAFSPDGRLLASAGAEHVIKLWDVETGLQIKEFRPQERIYFQPSDFSRNVGGGTKKINGESVYLEENFVNELLLANTPLSKYLLERLRPRTRALLIKHHAGPTPEMLKALADDLNRIIRNDPLYSEERFKGINLSSEVRTLLDRRPTAEGLPRLNRLLLEQTYPKLLGRSQGGFEEITFSSDGRRLAARTFHGFIHIWSVSAGDEISIPQFAPQKLAFSPDGQMLAVTSWPEDVILFDAATGVLSKKLSTDGDNPGYRGDPKAVSFSPDGKTVLSVIQYRRLSMHTGQDEDEGFLLQSWDVGSGNGRQMYLRQVKINVPEDEVAVRTQCASPAGRAIVYELARKVKDALGNERVSYQSELLKLDTRLSAKIDEGTRPADELWASDDTKLGCEFSPDGRLLAVAKGNSLRLFSAETVSLLKEHTLDFRLNTLSFSSNGSVLALAGENGVSLFDVRSGTLSTTLANHIDVALGGFSRDGARLILSRGGEDDQFFDLSTGKEVPAPDEHRVEVETLYTSKRWNLSTGLCVATQERAPESPTYIPGFVSKKFFSPDGKLAALPGEEQVQLADVKTDRVIRLLSGHQRDVKDVAFSPDGKILASGSWDKTIKLWDTSTWKEVRALDGYRYGYGMAASISFSPDGRLIAATGEDGFVKVWEVASGAQRFAVKHKGVLAVAFAPAGGRLVTAGEKGVVKVWDASDGAEIFDLKGHVGGVLALGFDLSGKLLATGGEDRAVRLWDLTVGAGLRTLEGHGRPVIYVGFSGEGELLSESAEEVIEVTEAGSKRKLQTFRDLGDGWRALLSPDRKALAVKSNEGIKFWNPVTARLLFEVGWRKRDEQREIDQPDRYGDDELWAYGKDQLAVAFLSRRKVEARSELAERITEEYTLKLWKLGEGGVRNSFARKVEISRPGRLQFSSDGKWLLFSGNKALLWNTEDPETLLDVGRNASLDSLDLSHDSALLAMGGYAGEIKLWDVAAQREMGVLGWHSSRITGLDFHPAKNILLSRGSDGTFKFWDVAAERELATLIPLDEADWVVVTPEGRFDASPNAVKLMHYVFGLEVITLEQIKDAYYEPGLLAKLVGSSREPLRAIRPLRDVKLYPQVIRQEIESGGTALTLTLKNRGGGIGPVRVAVNGKTVTEDARGDGLKANPMAPTAVIRYDLRGSAFAAGQENRITVTTSNYDPQTRRGYINSRGTTILFTTKGEMSSDPPRLYAIVGGISDYAGDSLDLRYAAKDAEDFAAALGLGAEKFFGARNVHIRVLSTTGRAGTVWPSKNNFREAFAEVARAARPGDVLVIYLAGHGVSSGSDADAYYYLTQEAQSASKESLSNPDVRGGVAITSVELTDWLTRTEWVKGERGIKPLKQVMILDTCAAGNLAGRISLMSRRALSGEQIRAIERLKDRTGFHILMGSAADSVSYEATSYGQGILTYTLLQAMRGAKLRDGEFADVSTLFQYAADEVPRLATDIGGIQKPIIAAPLGTSFDIGRFTKEEQARVPLAQVKPLILSPRLIDPEQGFDELGLEDALRRSLRESGYADPRTGAPNYIYVDADGMPGALRPSGTYVVRGNDVRVSLNLIRDGKKIGSVQAAGEKADVNTLADKLTIAVVETLKNLP